MFYESKHYDFVECIENACRDGVIDQITADRILDEFFDYLERDLKRKMEVTYARCYPGIEDLN